MRLLASLIFFTRLPWWRLRPVPAAAFRHVVDWWPFVGWLTGGVMGAVFCLALWLGFVPGVASLLAIAARLLLTGALHEDGLADFADGFGGGTTRERTLHIMKDSHIGTYGVIALILYFALLWSLMAGLPAAVPLRLPSAAARLPYAAALSYACACMYLCAYACCAAASSSLFYFSSSFSFLSFLFVTFSFFRFFPSSFLFSSSFAHFSLLAPPFTFSSLFSLFSSPLSALSTTPTAPFTFLSHFSLFSFSLFLFFDVSAKVAASLITGQLPYARTAEGAKNGVVYEGRSLRQWLLHAVRCTLALSLPIFLLTLAGVPQVLLLLPVPFVVELLLVRWMRRRLGGYTGDCCGALFLLCELSLYLSLPLIM